MDAIYRLDDGRYIDLDKVICIIPSYERDGVKIQFQLTEKFVYVFPETNVHTTGEEYNGLFLPLFDKLINVWKKYKQSKQI